MHTDLESAIPKRPTQQSLSHQPLPMQGRHLLWPLLTVSSGADKLLGNKMLCLIDGTIVVYCAGLLPGWLSSPPPHARPFPAPLR